MIIFLVSYEKTKGLFRSNIFLDLDTVALSIVFGKYCPTMA
jgi:hypothetical protein